MDAIEFMQTRILAVTRIDKRYKIATPEEVGKILELKENNGVKRVLERDKTAVRKRGKDNG